AGAYTGGGRSPAFTVVQIPSPASASPNTMLRTAVGCILRDIALSLLVSDRNAGPIRMPHGASRSLAVWCQAPVRFGLHAEGHSYLSVSTIRASADKPRSGLARNDSAPQRL